MGISRNLSCSGTPASGGAVSAGFGGGGGAVSGGGGGGGGAVSAGFGGGGGGGAVSAVLDSFFNLPSKSAIFFSKSALVDFERDDVFLAGFLLETFLVTFLVILLVTFLAVLLAVLRLELERRFFAFANATTRNLGFI